MRIPSRDLFDIDTEGLVRTRTALRVGSTTFPAASRVDVVQVFGMLPPDLLGRELEVYETAGVTVILIVF